jgi:hypothetical protein
MHPPAPSARFHPHATNWNVFYDGDLFVSGPREVHTNIILPWGCKTRL